MTHSEKLRKTMNSSSMSIAQLAIKTGTPASTLYDFARGDTVSLAYDIGCEVAKVLKRVK